jgi:hypothetical protein
MERLDQPELRRQRARDVIHAYNMLILLRLLRWQARL